MVNKSISMVQVRRIIQLKAEGRSKLEISKLLHLHTLENYFSRIKGTGKSFSELLQCDDNELGSLVFKEAVTPQADKRLQELNLYMDYYKEELTRTGVTRKTLWKEYHQSNERCYSYTQFCEHFANYLKHSRATMHFTHRAGEYLEVDFAGKSLHYIDLQTGEMIVCPVLVCTLPNSSYTLSLIHI